MRCDVWIDFVAPGLPPWCGPKHGSLILDSSHGKGQNTRKFVSILFLQDSEIASFICMVTVFNLYLLFWIVFFACLSQEASRIEASVRLLQRHTGQAARIGAQMNVTGGGFSLWTGFFMIFRPRFYLFGTASARIRWLNSTPARQKGGMMGGEMPQATSRCMTGTSGAKARSTTRVFCWGEVFSCFFHVPLTCVSWINVVNI